MTSFCFVLFLYYNLIQFSYGENNNKDKLCIDQDNRDACQQIGRSNVIECQVVSSKVDCMLSAGVGNSILTVLEPEEAVLGAALKNDTDQAVVIAEFTQDSYATVVLIRNGLSGLNSTELRYCHPGYDHSELITKYVVEELDRKIINYSCTNGTTLLQQKFEALSKTFQSSCRPGKWSEDENFDAQLKDSYKNLCDLCGTEGCQTVYKEPFNDTLTCLTERNGNLALTTVRHANEFLNNTNNAQQFRYLCRNGTITSRQCFWTKQTKRVFVTSRASANNMIHYIRQELSRYINGSPSSDSTIERSLAHILLLNPQDKINIIIPVSLSEYVLSFREIPSVQESIQCARTVRWSVTSDEELRKCNWLQQATVNVGLQPVISCSKSEENDTISNLDNIREGRADIAFVDADYGYRARKRNLTKVAYLETDRRQLSRIALIVRDNTSWFNGNFTNLKEKRLCLPEYEGKEWLTLLDTLIRNKAIEPTCDYGEALSAFVGDSCVPGANEAASEIPDTVIKRFCTNCAASLTCKSATCCNSDYQNKYYGSVGALQCLLDDSGDYAVVTLNDLPHNSNIINTLIRGVARNGSYIDISQFYDEESPLTILTAGEILTQQDNPKFNDIVLLLRSIEKDFGQNLNKAFKIFERFDHVKDLLFPDSTPGITISGGNNRYIANYQELLSNSENCYRNIDVPSEAVMNLPTIIILFIGILVFLKF